MTDIERIIIRMNETGLAVGAIGDRLVIEGDTRGLSPEDREALARLKSDLIAHLSAPREHVAILCKHRQPDGRACGHIVTYQRPTGKVAWCQTCYGEEPDSKHAGGVNADAAPSESCDCCKRTDWWISIYGNRICRVCHPPAYAELEDKRGTATIQTVEHDSDANSHANRDAESIVPNAPHVVLPLRRPKAKQRAEAPAMYVAKDLEHWITNEPHMWADKVAIHGKEFTRLTPATLAWFRQQVDKAEAACAVGKLPPEAFGRIVSAFCPVYEFALRTGLVQPSPALARAMAGGRP
jgi:hypothetical protein